MGRAEAGCISQAGRDRIARVALLLVLGSAFVAVRAAGDPYQPVRTLLLVLASAGLIAVGQPMHERGPRTRLALGLIGVLIASLLVSAAVNGWASAIWGVHGRFDGIVAWAAVMIAAIAGSAVGRSHARWLARSAGVAAFVQAGVVGAQSALGLQPAGTLGNQVIAGGWLAVCVALAAAGARAERGAARAALAGSALSGAFALGLAGSRGAWTGLIVAMIVLAAVARRQKVVLLAAACALLVVAGASVGGGESSGKLSPSAAVTGSGAARLEIWRSTLSLIADRPLLGVGPGRFLYGFARYESVEHARIEGPDVRADQAHSRPLHLAAEAGLPAAAAWVVLFGLAVASALSGVKGRSASSLVVLAGLVAYLGQALFSVHSIEVDGLGWLLAGMAVGPAGGMPSAASGRGSRAAPAKALRIVALGGALLVAGACVRYLTADVHYQRSMDAFERGDLAVALARAERAVRADPLTDIYRVAYADAASYAGADERIRALAVIASGLDREPESYDLLLARARILRIERSPSAAEAYVAAAASYPNGVTVRREAIPVCAEAGRIADARRLAQELERVLPGDPAATGLLQAGPE